MTLIPPPHISSHPGQSAASFGRAGRPGILTAVGVTSIVAAGLCLVVGLVNGVFAMSIISRGQIARNQAQSMAASAASGMPPSTQASFLPTPDQIEKEAEGDRARLRRRRDALVALFSSIREISKEQSEEIGAMLGRHGAQILPADLYASGALSSADLHDAVTQAGVGQSTVAGAGPAFFVLKSGRLEAFDDRAVFRPADGGALLRTSAKHDGDQLDGLAFTDVASAAPQTQPVGGKRYASGLNDQQVTSVIASVQAACGSLQQLNPSQVGTLRSELEHHLPPLVTTGTVYAPVSIASIDPDGGAILRMSNGILEMDAHGTLLMNMSNATHNIAPNPVAGVLSVGEFFASMLLAVFLLTGGIMMLRNSAWAGGMHWIYALIKLPLAILGGFAFCWAIRDLEHGLGKMGVPNSSAEGFSNFGIAMATAGVIYAAILMIVLSTGTVREFYRTERLRRI